MNAERIKTNMAILFKVNGIVLGFVKQSTAIHRPKTIGPKTNIQSTSYTGILLRNISATATDARSKAYCAAK